MAAMADDEMRHLYTLTSASSRKIEQLGTQPEVCWLFQTRGQTEVATLTGTATIENEGIAESLWTELLSHAKPYVLSALHHGPEPEFRVIKTQVASCEIISPKQAIFQPAPVPLFDNAQ